METTKHAGRKFLRSVKRLRRMLNKELPTAEICEWHLETFETNSGARYGMRVCLDYDHNILTYTEGEDLSIFTARVKKEINFYKHYDDGN